MGVRRARGAILFLAVGAIAALSILTLGVTSSVMQELRLASYVTDSTASFYAARSAIDVSRFLLAADESPGIVTLYDLRSRQIPLGDKVLNLSFTDEEGRLNMNFANRAMLGRLPGMGDDEILLDNLKAKPFKVKEEILLVDKMTPEIYRQFKNLVTVYGSGAVNINTAGDQVLALLGCDQEIIDALKQYRNGPDGIPGTEDDLWIKTPDQIVPTLGKNLSPQGLDILSALVAGRYLTTTSDYIAIYGQWGQGRKGRPFKVILNLTTGNIISWDEE